MKDIPGYEGRYSVTKEGKVFTHGRRKRFLKPHTNKLGYNTVSLWSSQTNRNTRTVHRLIAKTFIPNPDNKPFVNHIDGNKTNNSVSNLEWVTPIENSQHASRAGLLDGRCKGENNGSSKLTKFDVRCIRHLRKQGVPVRELLSMYDISESNIYLIIDRTIWKHVA